MANIRNSCMTAEQLKEINENVNELKEECLKNLDERDKAIFEVIVRVNEKTQAIKSCDLPTDKPGQDGPVLLVQKYQNIIFQQMEEVKKLEKSFIERVHNEFETKGFDLENASTLERLAKVSEISMRYLGGNCMQKAIFAFVELLRELIKANLINIQQTVKLELAFFNNHFILIVADKFLLDGLLHLSAPLNYLNIPIKRLLTEVCFPNFGNLVPFFVIDENWNCFVYREGLEGKPQYDEASTKATYQFLPAIPMQLSTSTAYAPFEFKAAGDLGLFPPVENYGAKKTTMNQKLVKTVPGYERPKPY